MTHIDVEEFGGASADKELNATLGNDFELSEISREALVYTKDMLLEKPIRRTPSKAIDLFDHPAQEMERVLGMYDITTATNPEGVLDDPEVGGLW